MLKIIHLMKTTRDSRQPSASDKAKYMILQMNAIKNEVSGALFIFAVSAIGRLTDI